MFLFCWFIGLLPIQFVWLGEAGFAIVRNKDNHGAL